MANLVIILICLLGGNLVRRGTRLKPSDVRPLNVVVLWISLPGLILVEIPPLFREISLSNDLLLAVAMPWLQFFVASILVVLLAKIFGWSRKVVGGLILTMGFGNTSFMGFPVIQALYGDPGLRVAILIDQLGTFLILATFGFATAAIYSGQKVKAGPVVRRIILFPPFFIFVFAALWGASSFPLDGVLVEGLKKISATLIPLALISVGWQLEISRGVFRRYWSHLTFGLGFKLLLWPALVVAVLTPFFSSKNMTYHVTVMEAAMGPMITGAVVATEFNLEPELAQLMVGVGITLLLITLPLWNQILKAI